MFLFSLLNRVESQETSYTALALCCLSPTRSLSQSQGILVSNSPREQKCVPFPQAVSMTDIEGYCRVMTTDGVGGGVTKTSSSVAFSLLIGHTHLG